MQRALDPNETIERMIMPEGFDLQPFTTEDMLPDDAEGNIMDMSFDERGRVWLAVTKDYTNDLGNNQDKIVIGEDTNGDGQVDEFTVFAEDLSIPTSMVLVENGVVVAHHNDPSESGQMALIRDTDGDDKADERQVLFSGFGNGDTHAGPNELVHGIDNWIWGQVGYSGFSGTVAGEQYDFSSSIYRFKLDASDTVTDFEIVGELPGNQAGFGFTEEGLVFGSAATSGRPSTYMAIPDQYYELINGTSPTDFGPASEYTVEWTNQNDAPHNFEIVDSNDEVVQDVSTPYLSTEGESQTVSFTATDEIAEYVCRAHNLRMRGTVELAGSDSN